MLAAALLILSLPGCPKEPEAEAPTTAEEVDDFPTGTAETGVPSGEMRTIEASESLVATGSEHYGRNCVPCHGAEGEGRLGIGPALNSDSFLSAASDGYLMRTIYRGRGGTTMPAWGSVVGKDGVEAIVAFIRSWKDVEPAELDDGEAQGDAEAGGQTFREICAACHGNSGAGYQETSNGTGIGRSAFLADASNGYLRYIIRHGKSNTPMRPFGRPEATAVANLTDEQIDNVIKYLRTNAW